MSTYFADTSTAAKRYVVEVGSSWVEGWIEPAAGQITIISELALVEMRSLLARRVREGILTLHDATLLRNDFLLHVRDEYLIVPLDRTLLNQAGALVEKHPLRTLDAIQLACALHAVVLLNEPLIFVSGDKNLLAAAFAEGFRVDDPNQHP